MQSSRFLKYFLAIFLSLMVINSSFAGGPKAKVKMLDSLNVPDEIAFFDVKGEKHFLDEFEGKTILVVFWATWCSSCVKEIPELDMLQKDFRKLPFEVVAVSQDFQGAKAVKDYFKAQEIRYLKIYHDYHNELFRAFKVVGLPSCFLINADGKMVASFTGAVNWYDEENRNIILSHIAGNPATPKNSYQQKVLNQTPKGIKAREEEAEELDKEAAQAPSAAASAQAPSAAASAPAQATIEKEQEPQESPQKTQGNENDDSKK